MLLQKKQNVDLHWWGEKILLIRNMNEIFELEPEEVFLIEKLSLTNDVGVIQEEISDCLEMEKDEIRNFIDIFIQNYREFFFISFEEIVENTITVSGQKGAFFPFELHVSLTNACFHRCKHCYKSAVSNGNSIVYEDLEKFLDNMEGKVPYLTLSGGEPTRYSEFERIVQKFSDKYVISILTSGYNLNDKLIPVLAKAQNGVTVSIYSSVPEKHDAFVGVNGSYKSIMDSLEKMCTEGVRVGVSTLLTEENFDDIVKLVKILAQNRGVKTVSVGRLMLLGRAKENQLSNELTSKKYKEYIDELRKNNFEIEIIDSAEDSGNELSLSPFKCSAGTLLWSIYENGEIHPCGISTIKELMLGNLHDFNEEILFNRSLYDAKISKLECIKNMYSKGAVCPFE